jgi:hypothetical protein
LSHETSELVYNYKLVELYQRQIEREECSNKLDSFEYLANLGIEYLYQTFKQLIPFSFSEDMSGLD